MKRLQIYIEADMDGVLALRAAHERTSKAALIRRYVAAAIEHERSTVDPIDDLIGRYDEEPGSVDELVYRR